MEYESHPKRYNYYVTNSNKKNTQQPDIVASLKKSQKLNK